MKKLKQVAREVLGADMIRILQENYGHDEKLFNEALEESMKAWSFFIEEEDEDGYPIIDIEDAA